MDSEAETVSLDIEAKAGVISPGTLSPVGLSLPFLVSSLEAGSWEERQAQARSLTSTNPRCVVPCYIEPRGPYWVGSMQIGPIRRELSNQKGVWQPQPAKKVPRLVTRFPFF